MYEYAHLRCIPDDDWGYLRRKAVNPMATKPCRYCGEAIETFGNGILGPFSGPFCRKDVQHREP